jgi:hypothetical protein
LRGTAVAVSVVPEGARYPPVSVSVQVSKFSVAAQDAATDNRHASKMLISRFIV